MVAENKLPRRKALLVGVKGVRIINEGGLSFTEIMGAHKDAKALRTLLINHGYDRRDITMLIDSDKYHQPTRHNILNGLRNLIMGAGSGDEVVFSFSGHGAQIVAVEDKAEEDGLDELLLPVDATGRKLEAGVMWSNHILDDEIRKIVNELNPGARCIMIFDCCHSGTAADLPLVIIDDSASGEPDRQQQQLPKKRGANGKMPAHRLGMTEESPTPVSTHRAPKDASAPKLDVISWSACRDADETYGNNKGGIFTQSLCKASETAYKEFRQPTNRDMLHCLRDSIKQYVDDRRKPDGTTPTAPIPQMGSMWKDQVLDMPFKLGTP